MASTAPEKALQAALAQSTDAVYKALVEIRLKLSKDVDGVRKLREEGNLKILLSLLGKPNMKIIDITLSILGNCSLEEDTRHEILKLNGVSAIVTILKGLETPSIQNRACRTLANLAVNRKVCKVIHKAQAVPAVVNFLHSTRDPLCQQTAVRSLRIFADSPQHRDEVITHEGLRTMAELLVSEDEALLKCLLKAMLHLTQTCSHQCAEQVLAGKGLESLVNLAGHKKDSIRQASVLTLVNLIHEPSIRPVMGNVGVIKVFVEESKYFVESLPKSCGSAPAFALCLCSLEAVNRKRIRETKGLKVLLLLLSKAKDERSLHEKVIDCLLNFIYDTESLKELLEFGLILALVKKLSEALQDKHNIHQVPWQFQGKEVDVDEVLNPAPTENDKNDPTMERIEDSREKNSKKLMSAFKKSFSKKMPESSQRMNTAYEPPEMMYSRSNSYWMNEDFYHAIPFRSSAFDSWDHSHRSRPPKSPGSASPEWIIPEPSPSVYRDDYFYLMRSRRSPRSWSPMSTSPSTSPTSSNPRYSPVYEFSEEEEEEPKDQDKTKETDESNWRNEPSVCDNDIDTKTKETLTEEVEKLAKGNPSRYSSAPQNINSKDRWWWDTESEIPIVNKALVLLARFSQMEKPTPFLFSTTFVKTLLNILTLFPRSYSRSEKIIQNLTSNHLSFEPFVLMHFPEQVATFVDLPKHSPKDCRHCEYLEEFSKKTVNMMSIQANTQLGLKTMQELMRKSNELESVTALLMIPYLYHERDILHKFYMESEGLKGLMNCLCKHQDGLHHTAIKSFLKLCFTIFPGQQDSNEFEFQQKDVSVQGVEGYCIYETDEQPKDVCFLLDDDEKVLGNRSILSRNCDVFDAMLQGSFSEATSDIVKFGDATADALNYVIHFLHGCSYAQNSSEVPGSYIDQPRSNRGRSGRCPVHSCSIEVLLEVMYLADRLLLPRLQEHVFQELVKRSNIAPNAFQIFDYAMLGSFTKLANAVVHQICSPQSELLQQLLFFKDILKTAHSEYIIAQMEDIVNKYLKLFPR